MGCCDSCMRNAHPPMGAYEAVSGVDGVQLSSTAKKRINNDVFQGADEDDDNIKDHDHLEKLYTSNVVETPLKDSKKDATSPVKNVTPVKTTFRESISPITQSTPSQSVQSSQTNSPTPFSSTKSPTPVRTSLPITEFSPVPVVAKDTYDGISPAREPPTPARLSTSSLLSSISASSSVPSASAPVTHNSREFRIFLPHIDDVLDKPWITRETAQHYRDALQLVTMAALHGNSDPEPTREDMYIIGQAYYGLKYRAGSKLELKVRTVNKPIWMEKWSKVKFGKKKLGKYKPDILTHLSDVGYGADAAINDATLENPRYLTITKSRNAWKDKNVVIEVVEISVPTKQEKFEESVKRKKWLSIAVEGDSLSIEEFILHSHAAQDLWKCFTIAKHIYSSNPSKALSSHFVPIVSGYPMWIRLCANKVNQEEVDREIYPSMDALLHFLK